MESRLFKLHSFTVVGKREQLDLVDGEHEQKIPELWNLAKEPGGLVDLLLAINNENIEGILGISDISNSSQENLNFDYWIAVNSSHTEDLTHLTIPAARWISFEIDGVTPQSIQKGFSKVFENGLKSHDLVAALPYQIEYYPPNYLENVNTLMEIWIPIEII
ncbi:MAG: effector binding domain-containing protein [Kurthia sp.]|nr:effector binding domain-containing protein [Candidatus Kurthia equi]